MQKVITLGWGPWQGLCDPRKTALNQRHFIKTTRWISWFYYMGSMKYDDHVVVKQLCWFWDFSEHSLVQIRYFMTKFSPRTIKNRGDLCWERHVLFLKKIYNLFPQFKNPRGNIAIRELALNLCYCILYYFFAMV